MLVFQIGEWHDNFYLHTKQYVLAHLSVSNKNDKADETPVISKRGDNSEDRRSPPQNAASDWPESSGVAAASADSTVLDVWTMGEATSM